MCVKASVAEEERGERVIRDVVERCVPSPHLRDVGVGAGDRERRRGRDDVERLLLGGGVEGVDDAALGLEQRVLRVLRGGEASGSGNTEAEGC